MALLAVLAIAIAMTGCSSGPSASVLAIKRELEAEHVASVITDGQIKRVDFFEITENGLRIVAELQSVEELFFGSADVTDEQLCKLSSLKNIRGLNASPLGHESDPPDPVSDAGVDCIVRWSGLVQLDLSRTDVTDKGVSKLTRLGNLQFLELRKTAVSDVGVAEFEKLQELVSLDISACTQVEGRSLEAIAKLPHLQSLFLHGTNVDDSVIMYLSSSRSLAYLGLSRTEVTDSSLTSLATIKSLKRIDVKQTNVTIKGVAAFRSKRPDVSLRVK
jgi:internalin A